MIIPSVAEFLLLLITIIIASIGFFTYRKNTRNATMRIFSLLCGIIIIWLSMLFIALQPSFYQNVLWSRLSIFFATLQCLFLILFAYTVPSAKFSMSRKYLTSLVIITVLVMITTITPYAFTEIDIINNFPTPRAGPLILFFGVFSTACVIATIILLIQKIIRSAGIIKLQLRIVLVGMSLMYGLIITTIFLPVVLFQEGRFVSFYSAYALIFIICTAYAITRYRFMDIRVVIRKSLITAMVIALSLLLIIGLFIVLKNAILQYYAVSEDLLILFMVVIMLYIFPKLKIIIKKLVDRYVFPDFIDLSAKAKEFGQEVPYMKMMEELAERSAAFMKETLKINDIRFFSIDPVAKDRIICRWPVSGKVIYMADPIFQYAQKDNEPIITEELALKEPKTSLEKRVYKRLQELQVTVAVPLGKPGKWIGLLVFGPRVTASPQPFSSNELDYMRNNACSIANLIPGIIQAQQIIEMSIAKRKEEEEAEATEAEAADIDNAAAERFIREERKT